MNNSHFFNLKQFIEEFGWKYPLELKQDTQIEGDLGITGDDAVEFIIEFGKKFDVDISKFMADEYFEPEGCDFLSPILIFFKIKKKKEKKVLTIKDLEDAIKIKELR